MSSKRCARCEKTVYPLEELKCLDKFWHKLCFKCQECGMTLNMKTYKGYNKQPYCNAHCPQAKHTAVADTPEIRRLAENTKLQSNVKYHEDFEKAKGKFTTVADDPETLRIRNTSKIISNVSYHGELERKKQMEQKRHLVPEKNGVPAPLNGGGEHSISPELDFLPSQFAVAPQAPPPQAPPPQAPIIRATPAQAPIIRATPAQAPITRATPSQAPITRATPSQAPITRAMPSQAPPPNRAPPQSQCPPGRISDYVPQTAPELKDSPYSAKLTSTVIYTSQEGPVQQQSRKIGSIADYDPMNENYGSIAAGYRGAIPQHMNMNMNANMNMYRGAPEPVQAAPKAVGHTYKAMYDYVAQDSDEISFTDGDLIVNCQAIDDGWMTGTVQRTGQTGMLPANYVEILH